MVFDQEAPWVDTLREQCHNGEEGNGFELWRMLFHKYEGGDNVVKNDGRTQLQSFGQLNHDTELVNNLDKLQNMMLKNGQDIGWETRRTMLLKVLPAEMKSDVLTRSDELRDVRQIIGWNRKISSWDRSEELIKPRQAHRGCCSIH